MKFFLVILLNWFLILEDSQLQVELQEIEERFKELDGYENDHWEEEMLDSLDKEIVPQPSFGSNYDNERNRLQLNVLDLEVNSQTSENEDERSKHNKNWQI